MNAILISAILGVIMMFTGAFVPSKTLPKNIAIAGLLLLLIVNGMELYSSAPLVNINTLQMLRTDSFSLTFLEIIFASTLFFVLISGRDFEKVGEHVAEYFALIFFVLCGISLSCTYNTLLILFLGIEIMSIPLYVLTGSDKRNLKSNEAALKYFLMGAFSTGLLLMGIAFIYGGNPNASFYIDNLQMGVGKMPVMVAVGLVFFVIALSFKSSAAPFHFWAPDVYDGAPTVVTSFMSTVVKVGAFFAFIRLFQYSFGGVQAQWQNLMVFITVVTLLIGNMGAIFQQSVKRMLAYSSIAQAGFMMLALFALNDKGREGILIYAAAYSIATMGLFAIVIKMKDYTVEGFNGLGKLHPVAGFAATIFLFSLTGIPLTAGFQAKFLMLMAAAQFPHQFWLVVVAVLFAAMSAYYYLRVIQAIYFKPATVDNVEPGEMNPRFNILLIVGVLIILIIGIYPELAIAWMYH